MEQKKDYDLDIMNILKNFPKTNNDAFIYIRVDTEDIENGVFIHTNGELLTLGTALCSFAAMNVESKNLFLNSVLNFLRDNQNEILEFRKILNMIDITQNQNHG